MHDLDIEAFRGYNNLRREQAANWGGERGAFPCWDAITHIDMLLNLVEQLQLIVARDGEERARLIIQANLNGLERDFALEKLAHLQEAYTKLVAGLKPQQQGVAA